MSFSKKINICVFGHFDYEALRDNAEMLKNVFSDNGFKVKISNKLSKNQINLVYEGHHPTFRSEVIDNIKKYSKDNLYIVATEELVFSKYLASSYFTFNEYKILNTSNEILKIIKLFFLKFKFKKKIVSKKNKSFFFNQLNEFDFGMKERFDFFNSICKYSNGIISTYDQKYLKQFCYKEKIKYFFIPHLFSKKDFVKKKYKKNNDLLFTGQLNAYRENLIKKINMKTNVESILHYKKRDQLIRKYKILLCLNKDVDQHKPSTNRTFIALKKDIIPIVEECKIKDQFRDYCFMFKAKDINLKVKDILLNFKKYNIQYQKIRIKAFKNFQSTKIKKKLISFLN